MRTRNTKIYITSEQQNIIVEATAAAKKNTTREDDSKKNSKQQKRRGKKQEYTKNCSSLRASVVLAESTTLENGRKVICMSYSEIYLIYTHRQ